MNDESLFHQAIERPADERAAFLEEACAGDKALRRRVDALVLAHDNPGSFLQAPAVNLSETTDSDPAIAARVAGGPDAESGRVIGPYKLLQQVGEGGMGTVWMAEQTQPVQRRVALKIIKAGMDSRQVLARFQAERQALALMEHPNIARVLDAGATPEGRPYFAMELVKGQSITRYCDAQRLIPRQRLELFVPVCQAIQHAHQKGIIHRDIKPSNVLVALYDGKPVVKVIDFGIAKATGQRLTEKTLFTEFGAVVGTLEYMSPEQAELNNQDIDTRCDIYSLGVLLYELLTGTTPLTRDRLKQAAFTEMLRMIREEEPPKPSTRLSDSTDSLPAISAQRHTEPAKLTRLVRGELDWIVMKALEKDRNRRYETANDFAADVLRYLADEPVQACPPSTAYRLKKLLRRNKGPVLAAALVLLTLLGGILGTTWQAVEATWAKQDAVDNEAKARDEEGKEKAAAAAAWLAEERAEKNAAEAKTERGIAAENAKIAEANERLTRRSYYTAQLSLALQALEAGDVKRALTHLESQRPRFDQEDLRTFEWYYLWGRVHSGLRFSRRVEKCRTYSVAFSPDGTSLALGGSDGVVRLYDPATGTERATLPGSGSGSSALAFSADGKLLAQAVGFRKDGVILWDLATGRAQSVLSGTGCVLAVAFAPDGQTLATVDRDRNLQLWDVAARRQRAVLKGTLLQSNGSFPSFHLAFSSDGMTLTLEDGHGINVWNLQATPPQPIPLASNRPLGNFVGLAPDGRVLATGGREILEKGGGEIRALELWHPTTTGPKQSLPGFPPVPLAVAFSPGGLKLAVGRKEDVILVDVATGKQERTLPHAGAVQALAISPNLLASVSEDGFLRVWDLTTVDQPNTITLRLGIAGIACSPDNRTLAVGSQDGRVLLYDLATERYRVTLPFDGARTLQLYRTERPDFQLAFSPDGQKLAIGMAGSPVLKLWDPATGHFLSDCPGHEGGIISLAFSPDGKSLAADTGTMIELLDANTGQLRSRFKVPTKTRSNSALAFASGGKTLATLVGGDEADDVQLWDPASGQPVLAIPGKSSRLKRPTLLAGSPDGNWLARSTDSGAVQLLDSRTGRATEVLRGDATLGWGWQLDARSGRQREVPRGDWGEIVSVSSLAFFPDGKTLAVGRNETVKLCDPVTGQERLTFTGAGDHLVVTQDCVAVITENVSDVSVVKLFRAATDPLARAGKTELDAEDPESPVAINSTGDAHWSAGRKREAEEAYRQAAARLERLAERFPDMPDYRQELARSWLGLTLVLAGTERLQEADEAHTRAFGYAATLTAERRRALADRHLLGLRLATPRGLTHWMELAPDDPNPWRNRAHLYASSGQPDKALADLSRAIEVDPTDSELWEERARFHQSKGQKREALADRSKIVELRPDLVEAFRNRGYLHLEMKQLEPAIADFSRAIELAPEDFVNWAQRGHTYATKGELDKAIVDYSRVIQLEPRLFSNWIFRGEAYEKTGELDKAIADYSEAIKRNPSGASRMGEPELIRRARCYRQLGRFREARADYEKALQLAPPFPQAHNELDWLLATCLDPAFRDPGRAVEVARKAVDMAPKAGPLHRTLGVAHYRVGDWKAAVTALTKSMELSQGGDAPSWFFLAMAHQQLGNKDEARKWYDKAVEWMEKNRSKDEELRRFRAEAAAVLELEQDRPGIKEKN